MSKSFDILALGQLKTLVDKLPKDGIVILRGDLSSGKTTLVKAIVKSHGISDIVTSPTFSIMHKYGQIYHYDIYNSGFDGLIKNGLFENLFEDGLHLVEWGDEKLEEMLKKYELPYYVVEIENLGDKRKYRVSNFNI